MPMFKQTPASTHYFKAQLSILKRPMFWAAASGLILSVFLVREYWENQQYASSNDLDAATSPPHQNPLGNLSTQTTPASNSAMFEALPELSTVPTQTRLNLQPSGTATQKVKPGSSQPSSFSGSSFSNSSSFDTQRDRTSASQLPSLYPLGSSALSGFSSTAATGDGASSALTAPRSSSQSSTENSVRDSRLSAPGDSFRQDSFGQESSPQGWSRSQFTPQLSPSPGTTGYTLPPTLRTSTPSVSPSSSSSFQPIPGSSITSPTAPVVPGQSDNYGSSYSGIGRSTAYPNAQPSIAPSSQPTTPPFSVPRSVPNRSIGGGQINTFSNP